MPNRMQVEVHMAEVNWVPLSVVTVARTPKCATQLARNASAHVLAQEGLQLRKALLPQCVLAAWRGHM
jgi:hypothetical protein